MAKRKSSLMTPDPYHTPGYCGYVPHFKYQIGETYGSHTHKLMTSSDPKVASSGNPVLTEILPTHHSALSKTASDFFNSPVYRNRTRSWGDQKYVPQMIPGYEGYIPRGFQEFGTRYAESCHHAVSAFEDDQYKHQSKREEIQRYTRRHSDPEFHNRTPSSAAMATPLKPIAHKAKPFISSCGSSHYMGDCYPNRFFISGYTGFVPKARRYLGLGYPIVTCHALQEHTAEGKRLNLTKNEPIDLHKPTEKVVSSVGLYPKEAGLLPRYTGHIPGQKFKYGNTFGWSTRDAIANITV